MVHCENRTLGIGWIYLFQVSRKTLMKFCFPWTFYCSCASETSYVELHIREMEHWCACIWIWPGSTGFWSSAQNFSSLPLQCASALMPASTSQERQILMFAALKMPDKNAVLSKGYACGVTCSPTCSLIVKLWIIGAWIYVLACFLLFGEQLFSLLFKQLLQLDVTLGITRCWKKKCLVDVFSFCLSLVLQSMAVQVGQLCVSFPSVTSLWAHSQWQRSVPLRKAAVNLLLCSSSVLFLCFVLVT